MKKFFFLLQFILFLAFNFSLLMGIYQLAESSGSAYYSVNDAPKFSYKEDFDPSLLKLNNVGRLTAYCDSLYMEKSYADSSIEFEESFPDIVSAVVRNRFFHGYSFYGFENNFMSTLLSKIGLSGLNAIVIPDDILKYPYAACSQQSIVMMQVLQRKGITTRVVGFQGRANGHFCFEVYYNGGWHFYDPDMEPDMNVLNAYNHPSVELMMRHQDILLKAYHQYPSEKILDIFSTFFYGKANAFAAPKAVVFQKLTKFFSYTIWAFFLFGFIIARRKYSQLIRQYHVRNNRIHISGVQPGNSSVYYPNYSA